MKSFLENKKRTQLLVFRRKKLSPIFSRILEDKGERALSNIAPTLSVSNNKIFRWATGHSDPPITELVRIADLFRISNTDLGVLLRSEAKFREGKKSGDKK